ncbi:hypothetical protein Vadar_004115 [Vaccinium darrowii]|uniref:Uncharacterized protein n=1 Tax=Vaccinium darrowii TaxID=229202 RepID=A0ACB7WXU0_9ERIC|nr:hypothetical protein Vadar_004115 [Vaccinium darrowii]
MLETMDVRANNDKIALATYQLEVKQALVQEFLSLKQGTMTVTQYMARFEELLRYALEYIPTDEKKARQFEWGLDLTLRGKSGRIETGDFC